jgi:hypothetical protein
MDEKLRALRLEIMNFKPQLISKLSFRPYPVGRKPIVTFFA